MGYYGASAYRGDYYGQGYRGDPGFFDFISDVGKGIAGVAGKVLPIAAPILGTALGGPLGTIAGTAIGTLASKVLAPGPPVQSPANPAWNPNPPVWAAAAPGTGTTAAMIPSNPFAPSRPAAYVSVGGPRGLVASSGAAPHYRGRAPHIGGAHRRHMNALNPRALGRALRRARGFQKYATKVLKLVGEKKHVAGFKKGKR